MKKVILVIACLAIIVFGWMHFLMPEKTTPHLTQFFSKEHKEVQRIQDWLKLLVFFGWNFSEMLLFNEGIYNMRLK
jgi:predicted MFS family arabinose efflux permease